MAEAFQFRTQLSGFNREDVSLYIERTAKQHQKELQTLRAALEKAEAERDEALARLDGTAVPEQPAAPAVPEDPESLELAAYRRAEAAERSANLRVQKQAKQLTEILDTLRQRCNETDAGLGELAEAVRADAERLQILMVSMEQSFRGAADAVTALAEPEA